MNDVDIANAIERGIVSQQQLITSLSLALIGGLLALRLQFEKYFANTLKNRVLNDILLLVSIGLASGAIVIGFLISGRLIEIAPLFFNFEFDSCKRFSKQIIPWEPTPSLLSLSQMQIVVFLGSLVSAIWMFSRVRK